MTTAFEEMTPHDHKDKWDAGDVAMLRWAYKQGDSLQAISIMLGRTKAAVRSKVYRESIKRS